jgi:diacylglycerol kinase family enzyme
MRASVLVNPSSGPAAFWSGGEAARRIDALFRAAGVAAELQVVAGAAIPEAARKAAASATDVVVAGGGDGTVSTVAAALAGGTKPLGVLPLGTWNNFARDLSIPLSLDEAVRTIAAGQVRAVDVGEVNGHSFINNASIGVYPRMVARREGLRLKLGGRKWLAPVAALAAAFRRFPLMRIRVEVDGRTVQSTTPLLFVGNNRYEISLLSAGRRPRIDGGCVCMYLVKSTGRFNLARIALRALFGRLDQAKDFEAGCAAELWVETRRQRLTVAKDGDVISLRPPLHFRSRPGALRVLAP